AAGLSGKQGSPSCTPHVIEEHVEKLENRLPNPWGGAQWVPPHPIDWECRQKACLQDHRRSFWRYALASRGLPSVQWLQCRYPLFTQFPLLQQNCRKKAAPPGRVLRINPIYPQRKQRKKGP